MTHRITFVATEELAGFLEQEAERRMTTISSVAQQLLAETYLREFSGTDSAITAEDGVVEVLRRHHDKVDFLGVEAKHPWRVKLPDDFRWERNYDYFDERGRAAAALRRWYE